MTRRMKKGLSDGGLIPSSYLILDLRPRRCLEICEADDGTTLKCENISSDGTILKCKNKKTTVTSTSPSLPYFEFIGASPPPP